MNDRSLEHLAERVVAMAQKLGATGVECTASEGDHFSVTVHGKRNSLQKRQIHTPKISREFASSRYSVAQPGSPPAKTKANQRFAVGAPNAS